MDLPIKVAAVAALAALASAATSEKPADAEVCYCHGDNTEMLNADPPPRDPETGTRCNTWDIGKGPNYCEPLNDALWDDVKDTPFVNQTEGLFRYPWCPMKWCYVNKGCVAEYKGQWYTAVKSAYVQDSDTLYFSYETCGNPNRFFGRPSSRDRASSEDETPAPTEPPTPEACACTGDNSELLKYDDSVREDSGTFCNRWDMGNGPNYCEPLDEDLFDKVKDTPQLTETEGLFRYPWCPMKWCYVQPGCVAEYEGNYYPPVKSAYVIGAENLYFSYEVCGNPNRFPGRPSSRDSSEDGPPETPDVDDTAKCAKIKSLDTCRARADCNALVKKERLRKCKALKCKSIKDRAVCAKAPKCGVVTKKGNVFKRCRKSKKD